MNRAFVLATALASATPAALALDASQVFEKVAPSVWMVRTFDASSRPLGLGSAVVVGTGRLVTNCHVLAKASSVVVRRKNVTYDAKLEHADPARDLCLLSVDEFPAPAVSVAPRESIKVGQRVFAIGNPRGLDMTLSEGLVSGLRGEWADGSHVLQTTAPISPGSSGGGLFDDNGRLVGITTFTHADSQNLNFALPAEWIAEVPKRAQAALARRDEETRKAAREAAITPFGTPLPPNVAVRKPSADTPAKLAAFSGTWYGRWYRGREHTLVVERINGNTAQLVYSWGVPGPISDASPAGFRRTTGQFQEDGSLTASLFGAKIVYRMNDDRKSLTGQYLNGASRVEGTFEQRELPQ